MIRLSAIQVARDFEELGFRIFASEGTAHILRHNGVQATRLFKVNEGRPNIVDAIKNREVHVIVNTPLGKGSRYDEYAIGETALLYKVLHITTLSGAQAAVRGIRNLRSEPLRACSLQEYHPPVCDTQI